MGTATAGLLAVASLTIAGMSILSAPPSDTRAKAADREGTLLLVHEGSSPEQAAASVVSALSTTPPALPEGMPTAQPSTLGKALDAPSVEEFGYARALAQAAENDSALRVDGSRGYEFLSLDVPQTTSPDRRLLEVQSYDYASSELVSQIVDLGSGEVSENRIGKAHPSPSEREALFAMDLVIASETAANVRDTFAKATGTPLTNPAQLQFVATSNIPALTRQNVPDCETDRCITFQGRSLDGIWLNLSQIVVNLTDRTVSTLT